MNPATMKKLVVGYIVAIPVLIMVTILQFTSVQGVVNSHRRLGSAVEIIREADALESALAEGAVAIRSLLSTGNANSLSAYQAVPPKVESSLQVLVRLTADDAVQQARIQKLEAQVHDQLELFGKALEARTSPKPEPGKPRETEVERVKGMTEVATLLGEIKKHEVERLPALTTTAHETLERTNVLSPIAGVLSIWMVLVAALLLYRDATRREWAGVERRIHTRLVETLPFGICLVDEHGLILYTNSAQDMLFGYEPGGLVGRHITSVHHRPRAEADELFDHAMEELGRGGEWRGEFLARRKNSTTFNCVCQAVNMQMSTKTYKVFLLASAGAQPAP